VTDPGEPQPRAPAAFSAPRGLPLLLVPSARNELRARPLRLVSENRLEHRFGLSRPVEELNDPMDLIRDDGVEDWGARIRRRRREIFGLLGGLLPLFRRCNCHPPWPTIQY
jgi:hypothetical protein